MMWHIVGIVQVDIKKDGAAEWGEQGSRCAEYT